MAGQKFQYDESGSTFFYFLLSFLALVLIPSTYYLWPSQQFEDKKDDTSECQCSQCKKKQNRMKTKDPLRSTKHTFIKIGLMIGWVALAALAYKVAQFDYEMANFDPYEILEVDHGASNQVIKKSYHRLSLIYHPDKETGDEKKFLMLTKAYQALTDETAKKNWELYGNPDGPGAMSFGIALPSWIVQKENSFWVLGLYALVFMIALPTVVGIWWRRSSRYSGDQVLMDTIQLYYYFIHKTPHMALKRALMILAASTEFERGHNSEIQERPSDNVELPMLMKQLPNLGEKNKERPLSFPYSVKARALLHAHFSRIPLNPETLDKDRMAIVKKCPYLIQEMVTCVSQLMILAHAKRISKLPTLDTIENCMKLSPMVVQALWDSKSPLLQLPHIEEERLRYFVAKRRTIRGVSQLMALTDEERNHVFKTFTEQEVRDIQNVAATMPSITMTVSSEVLDDEESGTITAGAIVTVTVLLQRQSLEELYMKNLDDDDDTKVIENHSAPSKHKTVVQRRKQKKGGGGKKVMNRQRPQRNRSPKGKPKKNSDSDDEHSSGASDDSSSGKKMGNHVDDEQDEIEWDKFQARLSTKRLKALEGKSKVSHSVHCPFFSEDKQEYWWVYVSDKKQHLLVTAPYHCTNLIDEEEIQLKFTAPQKPGVYSYTVTLRSDSYLDMDQSKSIKLDVKDAKEIPVEHPQWDISSEDEDKAGGESDASEYTTDSEGSAENSFDDDD